MAAKWVDEAAINPIMNYYEIIKSKCFYCKRCKNCQKFETYRNEFVKKGFWSFNKEIKYWDVYDPDGSFRNRVFKLQPIRATNFRM